MTDERTLLYKAGLLRLAQQERRTLTPGAPCPVCKVEREHLSLKADQVCGYCRQDARPHDAPWLDGESICCRQGCGRDGTRYDPDPETLEVYCDEHALPGWPSIEEGAK